MLQCRSLSSTPHVAEVDLNTEQHCIIIMSEFRFYCETSETTRVVSPERISHVHWRRNSTCEYDLNSSTVVTHYVQLMITVTFNFLWVMCLSEQTYYYAGGLGRFAKDHCDVQVIGWRLLGVFFCWHSLTSHVLLGRLIVCCTLMWWRSNNHWSHASRGPS